MIVANRNVVETFHEKVFNGICRMRGVGRRNAWLIVAMTLAMTWIGARRAEAACTLPSAGTICIVLTDQFNRSIAGDAGIKVNVVTEGPDGNIFSNPNGLWNDMVDGGAGDGDGMADGDIEVSGASLVGNVSNGAANKWYYQVISASGYVNVNNPVTAYQGYTSAGANTITVSLSFTMRVEARNQAPFADIMTGSTVMVSNSNSCNVAATDGVGVAGVSGDQDLTADGIVYIKCPSTEIPDTVTLTTSKSGYADYADNTLSAANSSQLSSISANKFSLLVPSGSIRNVFGSVLTPADANPSSLFSASTVGIIREAVNGGDVYIAADAAVPGNLTIRYQGYQQVAVAVAPVTATQTVVAYTGANALPYQIALQPGAGNLETELGGALTFNGTESVVVCTNNTSWAACNGSAIPSVTNYSAPYWLVSPGAALGSYYVGINKNGYVVQVDDSTVATGWAATATPVFSGADGLKFGLKVVLRNEIGTNIVPATLDALSFGGAAATANDGVNSAYFADTTAVNQALAVGEAGFVNATGTNAGFAAISTINTGQTIVDMNSGVAALAAVTSGATNNALGLQYQIRVDSGAAKLEDEFGSPITMSGVETLTVCTNSSCGTTQAPLSSVFNGASWFVAPTTTGVKWIRIQKGGYIRRIDKSSITASADAQVGPAYTYAGDNDGLNFTVVSTVRNELGLPVPSPAIKSGTAYGTTCVENATNTGLFGCPVPNGQTSNMQAITTGYLTRTKVSVGNANETGAQLTNNLTGASDLLYQIRVNGTNVQTELGVSITLAATDTVIACDDAACTIPSAATYTFTTQVNSATTTYAWFIAPATTGAKWIQVAKGGYVTTIDNASINANTTTQVNPSMITAAVDRLKFQVKLAGGAGNVETEAGTALTLAGAAAETVEICADAACSTVEPLLAAATFSGATWYLLPSQAGTKYIRLAKTGYVKQIEAAGINIGPAAQALPTFTMAGGDGLPYQIKVFPGAGYLENEFGGAMTFTGSLETFTVCTNAACTTTEAPSATKYSTGAWYIAPLTTGVKWIRLQKSGYIRRTDTSSITAVNTAQVSPAFTQTAGEGFQFTVVSNVANELGLPIANATMGGGAGYAAVCVQNSTNTMLFGCPVPNGQGSILQVAAQGYLTRTKTTAGGANEIGAQLTNNMTGASGLLYQMRLNSASVLDELGTAVVLAATDTVTVCDDAACAIPTGATSTFTTSVNAATTTYSWFMAPNSIGAKYVQINKGGFLTTIDATSVNVTTTIQANPTFSTAGTDRLKYQLKVAGGAAGVESEIGTALTLLGGATETVDVCTDATCGTLDTPIASTFSGGAWYVRPSAVGTKYIRIARKGFADRIDANSSAINTTTQTVAAFTQAGGDGLPYQIKMNAGTGSLEDEYGNALAFAGTETVTTCLDATCATSESPAIAPAFSGGAWYVTPQTTGAKYMRVQKGGYIRRIDNASITAATTGQVSPAFTQAAGDGLNFTVVSTVQNELGAPVVSNLVKSGTAYGTTCLQNATNTLLYGCAVPNGQPSAMQGAATGYVTGTKVTAGNANETGAQISNPMTGAGSLLYQIRVDGANVLDELGSAVVLASTDTVTVCEDAACATPTGATSTFTTQVDAATTTYSWFFAPNTTGAKYVRVEKAGFITTIDTSSITANTTTQVNPALTTAGVDRLKYALKVAGGAGGVESELGTAITLDGGATETVDVCADAVCSSTDPPISSTFNGGAWYLRPSAVGTKYVRMTKTGYVNRIDANSSTIDTTTQAVAAFTQAGGDSLRYQIKVLGGAGNLEDEFGNALTLAGTETVTTCLDASCTTSESPAVAPLYNGGSWYVVPLTAGAKWMRVQKGGYIRRVDGSSITATTVGQVNPAFTAAVGDGLNFTVMSVIMNELGLPVTGPSVNSGTAYGTACLQNATNTLLFGCPVPNGQASAIQGQAAGYVTSLAATVGNADETAAQLANNVTGANGLLYQIRINGSDVLDELGNAFTLASTDTITVCDDNACATPTAATSTFTTQVDAATTTYSWFFAPATAGAKYVRVARSGFVTAIDDASITANTTTQVNPTLATLGADRMKYQIKLAGGAGGVESEIGAALTLVGGATETVDICADAACSTVEAPISSVLNGGNLYVRPSAAGTKYVRIAKNGFLTQTAVNTIAVGAAAQALPTFTMAGGDGLVYQVRVPSGAGNIEDEFGNGLTLTGLETLTLCLDAACATSESLAAVPTFSGSSWYLQPLTTGNKWVRVQKPGYIRRIALSSVAANTSTQVNPTYTSAAGDGLNFTVVCSVDNELGLPITGATVNAGAAYGTLCTQNATNQTYFGCAIPNGQPSQMQASKSGYITRTKSTAGNANELGAQLTNNLIGAAGLMYQVRIDSSDVLDELGNAVALASTDTITICNDAACATPTGVATSTFTTAVDAATTTFSWFIAPNTTGAKYVRVAKGGFLTTIDDASINVNGASQTRPTLATAGVDRLKYQVKVLGGAGNLESEIGAAVALDGGATETVDICSTSACAVVEPALGSAYSGGAWYVRPSIAGAKYVRVAKTGYLTTIDAASININTTTQTSPALTQAGGDGLPYQIKVVGGAGNLEDEFGNALTLAGTETITTCLDSACATSESPQTAPAYSGGAWYAVPLTAGAKWMRVQKPGYIHRADHLSINANATTQTSPAYAQTAGDGLNFTVVSSIGNELGLPITGATVNSGTAYGTVCAMNATNTTFFGCAVPGGQPSQMQAAKAGYVTSVKAAAGNANETGSQIVNNVTSANGLLYQIRVIGTDVLDELGTAVTMQSTDTLTVCTNSTCGVTETATMTFTTQVDAATTTYAWFIAPNTAGAKYIRVAKGGFVTAIDNATINANTATQVDPALSTAAADRLMYQLKVLPGAGNLESETGAALTLAGTETVDVCLDAVCAASDTNAVKVYSGGSWYVRPAVTGANYVRMDKPGYVRTNDAHAVTFSAAGQVSPNFVNASGDGLRYQLKVVFGTELNLPVNNNLGAPVALPGGYTTLTYNGSAPTVTSGTTAAYWDVQASNAALSVVVPGYVSAQNTHSGLSNITTNNSTQTVVVFTNSPTIQSAAVNVGDYVNIMGLKYALAVTSANQFGLAIPIASLTSATFNGNNPTASSGNTAYWADTGTAAALSLRLTGYVNSDNTNSGLASFTPANTGQTIVQLGANPATTTVTIGATSLAKGLEATLKVVPQDAYGAGIATATVVVTGGQTVIDGQAGDLDGAADGAIYVAQDPSVGAPETITISRVGYINHVSGAVDLVNTSQQTITTANAFNTRVRAQDELAAAVAGMAVTDFYFVDAASTTRITPYDFHVQAAGDYRFALPVTYNPTENLTIRFNNDADPYYDISSVTTACPSALGAAAMSDCGVITLYRSSDFASLTPTSATIQAGGSQAFTLDVRDHANAIVTSGPYAAATVTVTLAGGSSTPASQKDIVSTTCANAPNVSGANDTTVTCVPTNGQAVITVSDNIVGDGTNVNVTTAGVVGADFPQHYQQNGTATLTIQPAPVHHFVLSLAAAQSNNAVFTGVNTLTAQDLYNNTVVAFNANTDNVTLASSNATATITGLGSGVDNVLNQAGDFTGGVANLTALGMKYNGGVGSTTFTATAGSSGATGTSAAVIINSGALDHFVVSVASPQRSAVAFTGTSAITAEDISNNVITTFDASVNNVTLSHNAGGTITGLGTGSNNVLNRATDFVGGVADLAALGMKYTGASGTTTFTATNGLSTGNSAAVAVQPGLPTDFLFTCASPQSNNVVLTGCSLTARDTSQNTVDTFDASINNVAITASLAGTVSGLGTAGNNVLNQATDFVGGVADLNALGMKWTGTVGSVTFTATTGAVTGTSTVAFNPGPVNSFVFTLTPPQYNNVAFVGPNTLTAKDIGGNTVTAFDASLDNVTITSASGTVSGLGTGGNYVLNRATDFVNGVANMSTLGMKYVGAVGSTSFSAAAVSGATGTSNAILIGAGAPHHFTLNLAASQKSGSAFTGVNTLTVNDIDGNVISNFDASIANVTITSNGGGTITGLGTGSDNLLNRAADFVNGVADLTALGMKYTGATGVVAFTATTGSASGTSGAVGVTPGNLASFAFNCVSPQTNLTAFAGVCQLLARDAVGNVVTGFDASAISVTLTSSASGTLSGVGSGSNNVLNRATDFVNGVADLTALGLKYSGVVGTMNLIATAGAVSGSATMTIQAGGAASFSVTAPATSAVNLPTVVTVTAKDTLGNTVTSFAGQVSVTSSDAAAVLPANIQFNGATGIATASISFLTIGAQTVTVTDTLNNAVLGTSGNITVQVGAATSLTLSSSATASAGVDVPVTVSLSDAAGNVAVNDNSTQIALSVTGGAVVRSEVAGIIVSGNGTNSVVGRVSAGKLTVNVYDVKAENVNITVVAPTYATATRSYTVTPASLAKYVALLPGETALPGSSAGKTGTPTAQRTGVPFVVTILAADSFGNAIASGTDAVRLTANDPRAVFATQTILADGSATASISLFTPGTTLITATNVSNTSVFGAAVVPVNMLRLQVLAPGETTVTGAAGGKAGAATAQIAGQPFTLTVKALDDNYNVIPGIAHTITITTDDTASGTNIAALTNVAMAAGVKSGDIRLVTSGVRTITISDVTTGGTIFATTAVTIGADATYVAAGITTSAIVPQLSGATSPTAFWTSELNAKGQEVLRYPYTSASAATMQVRVGTLIPIIARLYDSYGNPVAGKRLYLVLVSSSAARLDASVGAAVSGAMIADTDDTGSAMFPDVSAMQPGNYQFSIHYESESGPVVGSAQFRISFAGAGEPPKATIQGVAGAAAFKGISIMDGDVFSPGQRVSIRFSVTDDLTVSGMTVALKIDNATESTYVAARTSNDNQSRAVAQAGGSVSCTFTATTATTGNGECAWTLNGVSVGRKDLTLVLIDSSGNAMTKSIWINVKAGNALESMHVVPNPFNPFKQQTKVTFQSPYAGVVSFEMYAKTGQIVLMKPVVVNAGYNEFVWDGRDGGGAIVADGVYFYRLKGLLNGVEIVAKGKIAVIKK